MILVVDDDEAVRRALSDILAEGDYTVQTAASGREALDIAERVPPALVITDLIMPNLDGWEVVVALRQQGIRVPVILISGHTHQATTPAVRFLPKPIDVDQLLATVAESLSENVGNSALPSV
jgi:CheY-like chemotaxis protein